MVRKKSCFRCGETPWNPHKDCPAKNKKCFKCGTVGHYGQQCRTKKTKQLHEMQVDLNRLQSQPHAQQCVQHQMHQCIQPQVQSSQFADCISSMEFSTTPLKLLKTVKMKSINFSQSNHHIRPAWLSLQPNSPMRKLNCEVDTGARCNVMPYNILKSTFGDGTLKPKQCTSQLMMTMQ